MKQDKQNLYEGMYIVSCALPEDGRVKAFDKIKESITQKGGKVRKEHDMGKRRLAYQIGSNKEGHYFLLYFDCPTSQIDELWKEYQLNENLVRFMTKRTDKVLEEIKFQPLPEQ